MIQYCQALSVSQAFDLSDDHHSKGAVSIGDALSEVRDRLHLSARYSWESLDQFLQEEVGVDALTVAHGVSGMNPEAIKAAMIAGFYLLKAEAGSALLHVLKDVQILGRAYMALPFIDPITKAAVSKGLEAVELGMGKIAEQNDKIRPVLHSQEPNVVDGRGLVSLPEERLLSLALKSLLGSIASKLTVQLNQFRQQWLVHVLL